MRLLLNKTWKFHEISELMSNVGCRPGESPAPYACPMPGQAHWRVSIVAGKAVYNCLDLRRNPMDSKGPEVLANHAVAP